MELIKDIFSSFGIFNLTLTSKFALINVNGGIFKSPKVPPPYCFMLFTGSFCTKCYEYTSVFI